jgi:mRNA interferase YafQ
MRSVSTTRRFERDVRKAVKRGKDAGKLWTIVRDLAADRPMGPRHRVHRLVGEWADFLECYIEPDWLLIWQLRGDSLVLVRTGTHADLFD